METKGSTKSPVIFEKLPIHTSSPGPPASAGARLDPVQRTGTSFRIRPVVSTYASPAPSTPNETTWPGTPTWLV